MKISAKMSFFEPDLLSKICPKNFGGDSKLNKVRKNLFGTLAPAEVKSKIEKKIEFKQKLATKRWGFDFQNGCPLNDEASEFKWVRLPLKDLVPEVYALTRAAHVRQINPPEAKPTEKEALLDARAAKENFTSLSSLDLLKPSKKLGKRLLSDMTVSSTTESSGLMVPDLTGIRQPKITDFMKKRKRFAQSGACEASPSKQRCLSPAKNKPSTSGVSPSSSSSLSLSSSNVPTMPMAFPDIVNVRIPTRP